MDNNCKDCEYRSSTLSLPVALVKVGSTESMKPQPKEVVEDKDSQKYYWHLVGGNNNRRVEVKGRRHRRKSSANSAISDCPLPLYPDKPKVMKTKSNRNTLPSEAGRGHNTLRKGGGVRETANQKFDDDLTLASSISNWSEIFLHDGMEKPKYSFFSACFKACDKVGNTFLSCTEKR